MRIVGLFALVAMLVATTADARPRRGGGVIPTNPPPSVIYQQQETEAPETAQEGEQQQLGERVLYKGQVYWMLPDAAYQQLIRNRVAPEKQTPTPKQRQTDPETPTKPETPEPVRPKTDIEEIGTSGLIRIILPTKDTKLTINGTVTKSTGSTTRLIRTQPLTEAKTYNLIINYTDESGETQTQTRKVTVQPSQMQTVNFQQPQPQLQPNEKQ